MICARSADLIFRLVYVTTPGPELNVERVRDRVETGGHDVPRDKILTRWDRSMAELPWFAERADRLLVLDNSETQPIILALRHFGKVIEFTGQMPDHPALSRIAHLQGTLAAAT